MLPAISILIYVIVICLFLIASAFASAIETAYTSISNVEWKVYLKKNEHKKIKISIKIVNFLFEKYSRTIAMVLILNNILAIGVGIFTIDWLSPLIGSSNASIISFSLITLLLVIFGEFFPKNYAKKIAIKFVIWTSYITFFLWCLCFPVTFWLGFFFPKISSQSISQKMLNDLTDVALDDKVIDEHEAELVSSALEIGDKNVGNFITYNPVIVSKNTSLNQLLKIYYNNKYTRVIVLQKNNEIYGTLNFKILLALMIDQNGKLKNDQDIEIDNAISETLFLETSLKLDEALRLMQKFQTHIAVVTPSKNSKKMLGIITIEDILEELVGEIYDENDDPHEILQVNDYDWVIDQKTKAKNIVTKLKLQVDFIVTNKMRAKDFFVQYFKIPEFNQNTIYHTKNFSLKLERDLSSHKIKYHITKHHRKDKGSEKLKLNLKSFWNFKTKKIKK